MTEGIPVVGPTDMPAQQKRTRPLSYGEKAVGINFNPSKFPDVEAIKQKAAALIDELNNQRAAMKDKNREAYPEDGEVAAQYTLAIRKIQEGQMWGVKAATWLLDK